MNTLKYFEDYNLSLTQRLGKIAILRQPPGQEKTLPGILVNGGI
jgi:hypothetical protein